jgi:protein-S-isoprenylcysteine O-methyltransferase Ste14
LQLFGTVILVAWVGFWLYWIAAAASSNRRIPQAQSFAGIGIRLGIVLLALLLLRTKVLRANAAIVDSPLLQAVGLALFALGLALAVWARRYLGRNWGMPMSEKADPELVTTGPYRYVRHPIYSGVILAMIGTGLAAGLYWLVVAAATAAYFTYSAGVEERNMSRTFPATYPAYQRSTKMLIPFVL